MSLPDTAQWEMVCTDKMRTFEHTGMYEIVPCPEGWKIIGSKQVFHIKHRPMGEIQKYKARIVAQGCTQVEGVDYNETFTPVAKLSSIHAIFAIATKLNLKVHQMDVKSAYLNVKLEEIYIAPPDVYQDIHATLKEMRYMHLESGHAVFICICDSILSIIALYMDDISMASDDLSH